MQKQQLNATKRDASGKGAARRIRREGGIPAVVYGLGSTMPVTVNRKELVRILNTGAGSSTLLEIKVGSEKEKLAIIRDFQTDPVKNQLIHADFLEVSPDKPIHVTAAVVLAEGDIKGVKEGGILQHPLREMSIECLPANIPEHIVVDASGLEIGESLHVSDIKLPDGVKALVELEKVVATITAPVSEDKLEEMLSTEGVEEVKEPEVITKPTEEEEAE